MANDARNEDVSRRYAMRLYAGARGFACPAPPSTSNSVKPLDTGTLKPSRYGRGGNLVAPRALADGIALLHDSAVAFEDEID